MKGRKGESVKKREKIRGVGKRKREEREGEKRPTEKTEGVK